MNHRSIAVVLVSLLALQSVPLVARADDEAEAKALFEEARVLAKDNKWPEACEKLAQSKKLSPKMLTIYRLADCQERIGKAASAHKGFLEAADLAKAVGDSAKQQDAIERAKALEGTLARITLELPKGPLTITIDGSTIAPALVHEKIAIDPGPHELVASAEGKKPRTITFHVPAGPSVTKVSVPKLESLESEPEPPPTAAKPSASQEPIVAPPPADRPSDTTGGSSLKTAGFVALGVGAVGLGVGTFLGFSAKSLDREAEASCTPAGCSPEGKRLNDDARSRGNLATVVFVAGAVVAVTGVVLVLIAPSSSSKSSAQLAPVVGAGHAGFALEGRF